MTAAGGANWSAARAASEGQNWPVAVRLWGALCQLQSDSYEAFWRLAEAELACDRPEEAALAARRAEELRPGDPRGRALFARALSRLPDLAAARDAWQRVIEAIPNNFQAWARLAEVQAKLGDLTSAHYAISRALSIRPTDSVALRIAGRIARDERVLGVRGTSKTDLSFAPAPKKATDHYPAVSYPTPAESVLSKQSPLPDGARKLPTTDVASELRISDNEKLPPQRSASDLQAIIGRAVVACRSGQPAAALALTKRVLERRPQDMQALLIACTAAEALGDRQALLCWRARMLELEPGLEDLREQQAVLQAESGAPLAAAMTLIAGLGNDWLGTPLLARVVVLLAQLAEAEATPALEALQAGLGRMGKMRDRHRAAERMAADLDAAGAPELALAWLELAKGVEGLDANGLAFAAGRLLYRAKRWRDAREHFAPLLQWDDKRSLDVALYVARIARNLGEEAETAACYETVLARRPGNDEALSFFVRFHLSARRFREARARLEELATAAPASPHIPWLKASIAFYEGDNPTAIRIYEQALERHPELVDNYSRFADLLASIGNLGRMQEVLEAGLRQYPDSLLLLGRLLRCAELQGAGADAAIAICDRILAVDATSELGMRRRAANLARAGRREEAMAQYLEGTRAHPANLLFWRSAAGLAYRSRLNGEIDSILERAEANFAGDGADRIAALAEVLDAAGRGDAAIDRAAMALKMDERLLSPRQILARRHVEMGNFARAWPHLLVLHNRIDRPIDTTRLFSQVVAGFRAAQPSQQHETMLEPMEGRYPDAVFETAIANAAINDPRDCEQVVFHITSTLASGGAERQVALTCRTMAEMANCGSLPAELVAEDLTPELGRDFFLATVEKCEVKVHRLNQLHASGVWRELAAERPAIRQHLRMLSSLPTQAQRIALPLYVLLARRRPLVVHLWQDMVAVAGGLAAVLAGVPRIVLSTRSTRPIEPQRARPFFHGSYQALLSRPGVSMLGNSASGARDYEDWLGLPADSVAVVQNGYDFAEMRARTSSRKSAAIRAELGIPKGAPVLGGVMRCSYEKRPELWTQVACLLAETEPTAHAFLVGDGPMRPQLEAAVVARGLSERVRFVGRRSPVEPWMDAMDVLYLSSLTEGLPNVLIEAQSLGVAVATMRVGGAPETVDEDKTAIVLDEAEPVALTYRIRELLLNPRRRRALGKAGTAFVDSKFGRYSMVESLMELYARTVNGANPAIGELVRAVAERRPQ